MAERVLKKNGGNLPITILRPSIIVGCYDDPFVGWIDSPAASGGVTMGVCMGILHIVHAAPSAIIDLVPCDIVSSQILVHTAWKAMNPSPEINVVHAATTSKNPITCYEAAGYFFDYTRHTPWYG